MKLKSVMVLAALIFSVLGLCLGTAMAQPDPPYFIDDFEDGSAHDGDPVNWVATLPLPGESREVQEGSYVLTPSPDTYIMADAPEGRVFGDVSLRTQVRFLGVPDPYSAIGMSARDNGRMVDGTYVYSGYWATITNSGTLYVGRTLDNNIMVLRETAFSADPTSTDINLQFDLEADRLSLTAWPDGSTKPSHPQLSVTDSSLLHGEVAVWLEASNNSVPAAFRYVAAVPEPASLALILAGLLGVLGWQRRQL